MLDGTKEFTEDDLLPLQVFILICMDSYRIDNIAFINNNISVANFSSMLSRLLRLCEFILISRTFLHTHF